MFYTRIQTRFDDGMTLLLVYRDVCTPNPFVDSYEAAVDGTFLVDNIGALAGVCSLQTTVQASDLDQARYLYDQLAVVCPVLVRTNFSTVQSAYDNHPRHNPFDSHKRMIFSL